MTAITIGSVVTRPEADPYLRDTHGVSRTVFWLEPRARACGVSQEYRNNLTSPDVWHHRVLEWSVAGHPAEDDMREWIEDRMPDLVGLCDGHEVEWDGNNWVGRLTENASAIREALELDLGNGSLPDYYEFWVVDDWIDGMRDDIAADTTDEELRRMAHQATMALAPHQVLDEDENGVYQRLARFRQERIDELD